MYNLQGIDKFFHLPFLRLSELPSVKIEFEHFLYNFLGIITGNRKLVHKRFNLKENSCTSSCKKIHNTQGVRYAEEFEKNPSHAYHKPVHHHNLFQVRALQA